MKRTLALIVVPPVLLSAVVVVTLALLAPRLPSRFAVHWSAVRPDRIGGMADVLVPVIVLVPILTAMFVGLYLLSTRVGSSTMLERAVVVTNSFASLGVAFTSLSLVLAQREVADVRNVSILAVTPWIAAGFLLALLVGIGGALLTRPVLPRARIAGSTAGTLDLRPGERATWTRSVRASLPIIAGTTLALVALAVTMFVAGLPWVAAGELVLSAVVLANLIWRVTVDANGLRVRSLFGVPRFSVAASDVLEARVIPVDPLRQFGGWGIRIGTAGFGVIMRGGQALEVQRAGKTPFIVTVDDAETAAALLNTQSQRAHA